MVKLSKINQRLKGRLYSIRSMLTKEKIRKEGETRSSR